MAKSLITQLSDIQMGYFFDTMGGASINAKAQVVDVFNDTIPRLYAAGRTTGGLSVKFISW